MGIKHMPEDDRPREKLVERGPGSLSDAEILAIFFGTGRHGASAVDLGRELLDRFGNLRALSQASLEELQSISGIGPVKAVHLASIFEFGRRLAREPFREINITSPEDAFSLLAPSMQGLSQESVRVILLNHRKRLIRVNEIFRGTGNESFANPTEILRSAIAHAAHSLILAHNHPSGDPSPSSADHDATRRLKVACQAIGLELTDHIIIGCHGPGVDSPYFSFREAGLL